MQSFLPEIENVLHVRHNDYDGWVIVNLDSDYVDAYDAKRRAAQVIVCEFEALAALRGPVESAP